MHCSWPFCMHNSVHKNISNSWKKKPRILDEHDQLDNSHLLWQSMNKISRFLSYSFPVTWCGIGSCATFVHFVYSQYHNKIINEFIKTSCTTTLSSCRWQSTISLWVLTEVASIRSSIIACISKIAEWCATNKLQLNGKKAELLHLDDVNSTVHQ